MEARLVEREREMEELKFMLQRKSFRLVEPTQQRQVREGGEPGPASVRDSATLTWMLAPGLGQTMLVAGCIIHGGRTRCLGWGGLPAIFCLHFVP